MPLFIILFLEKSILFLVNDLLSPQILLFRSQDQEVCFLEGGASLLPLILELRVQSIIDHEALVHGQFTCHPNQVAHSLVEIRELRNLSLGKDQLLEVVKLSTQPKVLMG